MSHFTHPILTVPASVARRAQSLGSLLGMFLFLLGISTDALAQQPTGPAGNYFVVQSIGDWTPANFSDGSTWVGGSVPSSRLLTSTITNRIVTMDMDYFPFPFLTCDQWRFVQNGSSNTLTITDYLEQLIWLCGR